MCNREQYCRGKIQTCISIDLFSVLLCLLPTQISDSLLWEGHGQAEESAGHLLCLHFPGNSASLTTYIEKCSVNKHPFNIWFYSQFSVSRPMLYFKSLHSCLHSLKTQMLISSWVFLGNFHYIMWMLHKIIIFIFCEMTGWCSFYKYPEQVSILRFFKYP